MAETTLDHPRKQQQTFILITFLLGVFIGALDQGIISPALTTLIIEFAVRPEWSVWTITAYVLVYAMSMPVLGKMADRYGRKKVFMAGVGLFALGSLLSGLAPNFWWLLLGRAVQAVGGGGIFPVAVAEIGLAFPPEKGGKALGVVGGVHGLASIVAPNLGGFIIHNLTWHWVFLINIPVCLLIILLAVRIEDRVLPVRKPLDRWGIVLVSLIIFFLMYGLTNLKGAVSWTSLASDRVWPYLLAALVLVPPLWRVERGSEDPVVRLDFFRNRQMVLIYLISVLTGMVLMSMLFLPALAETLLGLPAGQAGYVISPLAVAAAVAAPLGGVLIDRYGARRVILLGYTLVAVSSWVLVHQVATLVPFLSVLGLMGFGMGFVIGSPLNYLVLGEAPEGETSSALAMLTVIRSLGSIIGPILMAGLIAGAAPQGDLALALEEGRMQLLGGFRDVYGMVTAIAAAAMVLALALRAPRFQTARPKA